jgi:murein DD-endopeptidase MepM/ murein hydrolase activator NlpD
MADNIPSLDDLLKSIQEEDDDNIPGLDDLLESIKNEDAPQSSSALAVIPKKPEDLVEEDIDSQILSILGLEEVFDLTYEEYASLLKEAAVKGRMPDSQMTTESIELVTNELKRVRNKTGRFKVKPKKVDINKVLDRKQPTPSGAIVKAQKLIPQAAEVAPEQEKKPVVDTENLQEDLLNGIGNILESLITIRTLLSSQSKTEQKAAQEDRKETEKKKKKERESTLEKKKPKSPILKALTKPVDDFFGAIKRFFTNVLLGSVVLGLFKWLKDPANQKAIDGFANFLQNNAGLILGGLLAIALLPIAPTLLALTSAISTIAIPALTAAFGFLASPAGLAALAGLAAGAAAATLQNVARPALQQLVGGESVTKSGLKFRYEDIVSLRNKAYDFMVKTGAPPAEVNKQMKPYEDLMATMRYKKKLNDEMFDLEKKIKENKDRSRDPKTYENLTQLQKNQLRERFNKIDDDLKSQYKQKKEEKDRASEAIKAKFEKIGVGEAALEKAIADRGGTVGRLGQPAIQPQTPAVPGTPPSQKGLPSLPPTNTLPGKQHYGADRGGGRKHAGVDFDAGPNDSFYSRIGGEVTNIGNDPGGYYKYVDIYNPELGVTERIAEGDTILVRKGQKVSPGTPVTKGTNTTGVFHYEIRKGKATTFGFAGTLDPIAFLGNPTTQTQVAQSPAAQVAQTPAPTPSIPSPTGRGNIVPIPIPTGGGAQQASSGTAPNQAPVPRFSSEDPNNTTTMVVRAIYNIVG